MHASAQYNDIVPATLVGTSNMGPSEQDDFSMSIDLMRTVSIRPAHFLAVTGVTIFLQALIVTYSSQTLPETGYRQYSRLWSRPGYRV